MASAITRRTFTNPTTEDYTIQVAGDFYIIEDLSAGDDDRANRTTIHTDDVSGDGIPMIRRSKAVFPGGFNRLVVRRNANATTSNSVTILIGNTEQVDLQLPSA